MESKKERRKLMKKSDLPEEVVTIEKEIRGFGKYAKLNYHQWQYASLQLFKNREIGFLTRDYLAENPADRNSLIHIRFGWNLNLELYAAVTSYDGDVSYYGPYIDKKQIKKYRDKGDVIAVKISYKLKTAYKTALAKEGVTMRDSIMKHIMASVRENLGVEALEGATGNP
jgi:hypothetical protein